MFAPRYHPSMKHAMPARKQLGMKTIFNGGASINVLCRSNGIDFQSYDVGIHNPTANFLKQPAMSMGSFGDLRVSVVRFFGTNGGLN